MYIASVFGREILVMDPETGQIINRFGAERGVDTPDDLAFGPDGSLYWTSIMTGEVGMLTPQGGNITQKVAMGVNPITFSDDGRLFVALDFFGDGLYELDPGLIKQPRLIIKDLGWLNGMDWGQDGYLYGPIWSKGKVVRIDVKNGTNTSVAEGFGLPAAVKFDAKGYLYVADHMKGEISRVDVKTGGRDVISTELPGLDNLAFDSKGRLFVSNAQDGSIFEIHPDGTKRPVSPGGMIAPGGVAVMQRPDGESVFVADIFTLHEFDGLTGKERSIERDWIGVPDVIVAPNTVSSDGDKLVLSSWISNAVQVWDPKTRKLVRNIIYPTDFPALPINAISFQGDLVISELKLDGTGGRVVRVNSDNIKDQIIIADGLTMPAGLAAKDNNLWVSDWVTGMVLQITIDGKKVSTPIQIAKNLSFPEGLAPDGKGGLLVIETGAGRLSRIDIKKQKVSIVAEGLDLGARASRDAPPTWIFNGVAVGRSGAIYVTGDTANVLYRIESEP
ncbi:Virginiamycin B lyase [uncultured archaeon]|nr:Virginiamycin B lyase [uncultured archaeon]